MRRHLSIVTAAAITVGAMGFTSTLRAQDNTTADQANKPTVGQKIENAADKTGDAIKNAADKTGDALKTAEQKTADTLGIHKDASAQQSKHAEEIHDVMAQVAEAALTKKGLDDMAERFVDADRNRLGQNQDALKNNEKLDGRIDEFRKDWKAKYNQDFDIKDEDKVYDASFAQITEGEEGKARTASDRISGDVSTPAGRTDVNVNVDNKTGVDKPAANTDGQTAADSNRNDPGRNIATVHIAASHGMPAVDVPMIHEAGGWKLDIPDTVDSNKLRDNVLNALTHCDDKKDQWPSDVNEAYRAVTHSVLLAVFDKPLQDSTASSGADTSSGAQPAAGQQLPADQGTAPTATPGAAPATPSR